VFDPQKRQDFFALFLGIGYQGSLHERHLMLDSHLFNSRYTFASGRTFCSILSPYIHHHAILA
jgi:hypothetical protein